MKKKNKFLLVAAAGAVATIYSAIEGKGIFNKVRFASVHNAVSRYVADRYPTSAYSPIEATKNGYITTVFTPQGKVALYITKTKDESFVFEEMPLQ